MGDRRVDFEEWEPVYERILSDFGYGRAGDEQARDHLWSQIAASISGDPGETIDRTVSSLDFSGETVAVAGGARSLRTDLDIVEGATAVVAASNAAEILADEGYDVDCMVTDLDKVPGTARQLTQEGTPVAVHAHGDNIELLESHVPSLEAGAVIPTTQAEPTDTVRNFGGFTDGDRGAFLAHERGASRLVFPGWDFEDGTVSPEKRRKLDWAARLLYWLEQRRDDSFTVLDGRRERLDSLDWTR